LLPPLSANFTISGSVPPRATQMQKNPDRTAEQPAGQVPSAALLVKLWKPQVVTKI